MIQNLSTETELGYKVVDAVAVNDRSRILDALKLLHSKTKELPSQHIANAIYAIETDDWNPVAEDFQCLNFIGNDGYFLFVAPSRQIRIGRETTKLTAIYGQQIKYKSPSTEAIVNCIEDEFASPCKIPQILPYKPFAVAGNAGEQAEAFNVANGFDLNESHRCPSFNNMSLQRQRFKQAGMRCLQIIFDLDTANYLLSSLEDEEKDTQSRCLEYFLHDVGHGAGLGLEYKDLYKLLTNPWAAGVEESRSDGIAMYVAAKTLTSQEASQVAVTNICVRLGLDAYRNGGINRDGDVIASLLNFSRWWDSNELDIHNGKLCLKDLTPKGLLRLVRPLSEWAVRLTHQELTLDYPSGLSRLYGGIVVNPAVESIFKGLVVEPCQGIFKNLN
jgi:hypothetical protein